MSNADRTPRWPDPFERVVCAVGGTRGGVEAVRQIERLRPEASRLVLVGVAETHLALRVGWTAPAMQEELRAEAQAALDTAQELAPTSVARIVEGRPPGALLWVLGDEEATLVACQNGHSRAVGMLLGTVPTTLLHDAPCSVYVARPPQDPEGFPRSIVVGVDGSPESLAAVDVATKLGDRLGVKVRPLAAIGGKPIDSGGLAQLAPGLELTELAPVDALVQAAESADLVVVGSRGLHGLRSLGSVSERVAHGASCSVLVVRHARVEREPSVRVGDVMTTSVVTADRGTTVHELARLMVERGVGSVVITDDRGAVVGIVTETDFELTDEPVPDTYFRWPHLLGRHVWSEESLEEAYAEARGRQAASLMSSPVTTVAPGVELRQAAETMMQRDVKHLPVVEDGVLVGIVSRHDLLKGLVAPPS
jgi:CBS domain-containing protein